MDGCSTKELPAYKYGGSTPAFGSTGAANTPVSSMDGGKGVAAVGGSGVEEIVETGSAAPIGGGRKKKKKHKSGEESSTSAKSAVVDEELADTVLPMLSDNQDVEELLFPSTLPPSGGTLVAGQYLLNNSLLDQILTEKKMQILQSPEVIEFLRKQLAKK
ncbi:uncharacterized protein LOC123512571 [Portunus trituberculatus]|uniref:uncharacterized protein LOC123512571 n=1 Tax=Portunus trituberculatus TaxID=210409 RepID=UPI001E1CFFEF|nr:uncharacterized protein LOC123512571 [Portunus trituberculatus]